MSRMRLGQVLAVALLGIAVGQPDAAAQMRHEVAVSAAWLGAHLDDEHVVLLHVETRRARYEAGHLPGAAFLDLGDLVWEGDPPVGTELRPLPAIEDALERAGVRDDHHHVVVYSENPLHAARAFMTLEVVGLRGRVQVLDGGLAAWREEGREVTTVEPSPGRGEVVLSPRDDILVRANWIRDRLDDASVALVDARPDDEYTGADGGMGGRVRPGHIPGAAQLYWEDLIESRESPRLRARTELAALFERAGAAQGDTVVTYCMVGLRASFTYLAARLLGYETKFYDGSWHDWGARSDLPVVAGARAR